MAVNFALSAARAHARSTIRETRTVVRQAAAGWRERRENDLREMGVVIPLSDWLGHNNGPDIIESQLLKQWRWTRLKRRPSHLQTLKRVGGGPERQKNWA